MIKTYQEDLTLAAPLYSETDYLWPLSPSDPNWYYGDGFSPPAGPPEWVSGKGTGVTYQGKEIQLRKMHTACAVIDCNVSILLEGPSGDYGYGVIYFLAANIECVVSISSSPYLDGSLYVVLTRYSDDGGIHTVELDPAEVFPGVFTFRLFDDVTHYRLQKNGVTLASIEKTPENVARHRTREYSQPAFKFSAGDNTPESKKVYLRSVDFEYDEYDEPDEPTVNQFWTDLINCHETT